ncbi:MAG: hypothetical protein NTV65_04690 [Proteobacteria bacterium]|nr:hypothetical protein [Pseudomonadota bacterium]
MYSRMIAIASVIGSVVCGAPGAFAQLSQGEKDAVFIGVVKVQPAVHESAAKAGRTSQLNQIVQGLRGQLVTELNQTRVFQIVERDRKEDIELEQAFSEVAVDPNDKNRAQTMKMAGAKYAFLPQIDGFEDRTSTTKYEAIGRSSMSRSAWVSATVSIVDTTTGAILPDSPSVTVKSGSAADLVRQGASLGGDALISALTKELAQKLSQESIMLIRPPKVLTITGNQVMINRGTEAGFDVGVNVEFFVTEDVKDDDTGEVFKNEVLVGAGTINRADPQKSFAEPSGENLGIAKNCVVRITKGSAQKPKANVAQKNPVAPDPVNQGSGEKPLAFN